MGNHSFQQRHSHLKGASASFRSSELYTQTQRHICNQGNRSIRKGTKCSHHDKIRKRRTPTGPLSLQRPVTLSSLLLFPLTTSLPSDRLDVTSAAWMPGEVNLFRCKQRQIPHSNKQGTRAVLKYKSPEHISPNLLQKNSSCKLATCCSPITSHSNCVLPPLPPSSPIASFPSTRFPTASFLSRHGAPLTVIFRPPRRRLFPFNFLGMVSFTFGADSHHASFHLLTTHTIKMANTMREKPHPRHRQP